ncbi:hypothetical protein LPJ53_003689 [Coemansia erecta]|uniref:gamma-glutamylcyclotransferase n=1 Tax=Coemansia erecta TaxID=147472 RepID=A0A9W7Y0S3_9FUNG|nr:hypothetical protein LPJ53_003689 [Coemansia erecta]
MSSKVLSGRRQVYPTKSLPVTVPGYQLTFDMVGIPYFEPGFGTIMPVSDSEGCDKAASEQSKLVAERMCDCQAGSPLHCIAHLITRKELQHIINTEGGNGNPDFGYQLIEVECNTYDGQTITGVTLIDTHIVTRGYHPSPRYLKIIMDGAEEHKLDSEYIERLKLIKPYVASTIGQKIAKGVLVTTVFPFVIPVIISALSAQILKTKPSRAISLYFEGIKRLLWTMHDWVLRPVFGKGC